MATPTAHGRRARHVHGPLGDEALRFARWFVRDKFQLMAGFLEELEAGPRDVDAVRERFVHAVRHARRVLLLRLLVTALLALSVLATLFSTVLNHPRAGPALDTLMAFFGGTRAGAEATLLGVAAIAGSMTILLLVLRLAFDRYLELVDTTATFLAIEIASSRPAR